MNRRRFLRFLGLAPMGAAAAAAMPTVPEPIRHAGGIVTPKRPYVVGSEPCREVFLPDGYMKMLNSRIFTNEEIVRITSVRVSEADGKAQNVHSQP